PARDVHAAAGPRALAAPAARARVGLRLREPLQRRRRLRPLHPRQDRPPLRNRVHRDRARRGLPAERDRGMSGLPIRLRLTLVFATAMAVVLTGAGLFLYVRLAADLSSALDLELRSRAQDLSALVRHNGSVQATSG